MSGTLCFVDMVGQRSVRISTYIYIVMAYVVMAHIVIAHIVMACIVMAETGEDLDSVSLDRMSWMSL